MSQIKAPPPPPLTPLLLVSAARERVVITSQQRLNVFVVMNPSPRVDVKTLITLEVSCILVVTLL
jgi:hypothetical protein